MTSLGGSVPLNVHIASGPWSGRPGWKRGWKGSAGLMLEFRLGGTPGLYVLLTLAPSCETSTAIWGGKRVNSWCAQMGPGGRPSMGPVPPPSAGSTVCWVVLACAIGAGTSVETAFRGNTSKRGIGCENFVIPNVGLAGRPVGTLSATASGANAHSPTATTSIALSGFQGRCTAFLLVFLRTKRPRRAGTLRHARSQHRPCRSGTDVFRSGPEDRSRVLPRVTSGPLAAPPPPCSDGPKSEASATTFNDEEHERRTHAEVDPQGAPSRDRGVRTAADRGREHRRQGRRRHGRPRRGRLAHREVLGQRQEHQGRLRPRREAHQRDGRREGRWESLQAEGALL